MKILFLARHFSYLRNFELVIAALAERGHQLHLAAERDETLGGREMVERIAARFPNVTMGVSPVRGRKEDPKALRQLRLGVDYLRFLDARYGRTPHLRARALDRAPERIVALSRAPLLRRKPGRALLTTALRWLERGAPPASEIETYLGEQSPDIVLLTPLVDLGSPQVDAFVAAKALGLRTVLCVGSWDHLSSKARLRAWPDLVTVWNPTQKQETTRMHGVPADRVTVTGAQAYDHWFTWQPARSREDFCARVGLPVDRPYILYVCSSLFRGTADESVFVEKWIRRIRESADPVLNGVGILIRPHPSRLDEWKNADLSQYEGVAFWGAHPIDRDAKDDYFDSMHYAAAVAGLNTSAFLEASVLGKSVFTVLLPKYSKNNQEGTIHFHYLLGAGLSAGASAKAGGGLLHVARTFDEHVAQLGERLAHPEGRDPKSARFVDAFIRPFGAGEAATARFVDAIERAGARPAPAAEPYGSGLARALWPSMVRWLGLTDTEAAVRVHPVSSPPAAKPGARMRASPIAPKVGKLRDAEKRLAGADTQEARETRALVEKLSKHEGPILVGPWVSEAGFELLYWIPFLRWACAAGGLRPEQITVVSRGGSAPWYRPFAAHYEDVFTHFSPEEFRARNEARVNDRGGRLKHTDVSEFDREILERVKQARGIQAPELLHPSVMYRLFHLFWMQHVPVTLIESFTVFSMLPESPDEAAIRRQLPDRYVCAKFYGNTALPDSAENRAFVASMLERLASASDVVLLDTGVAFDDHADYPRLTRSRLHPIDRLMTAETNLAVQTAAIRGAQGYVGTYGGFSYLAPLCGTDAVTFYSHPQGFRFDHLEVAKRVFAGMGAGGFTEIDVRRVNALQLAFGDASRPAVIPG